MNSRMLEKSLIDDFSKKIYLKPYFTDEFFDELNNNLPNDLMYDYLRNEVDDADDLIHIADYVYNTLGDNGEMLDFPFKFNFSIVNDLVVENDRLLLEKYSSQNSQHKKFRPYFFEFSGYCTKREEVYKLLQTILADNTVLSGFFVDANNSEFLTFLENNRNQYNIIARLSGEIMFSSSPIELKAGQLVIIEDQEIDKSDYKMIMNDSCYYCKTNIYDESRLDELNSILNKSILGNIPESLNIYNVGQGNCASVDMRNGGTVFFDLGLTKDRIELANKKIKKAKLDIRKINADAVILSHWDLDHILGVTNADKSVYDAIWVVPDLWGLKKYKAKGKLKFISNSAKRLLKYLDWKNPRNLFIIDMDLKKKRIYTNHSNTISIWTGEMCYERGVNAKKRSYCVTPANNFGILLHLSGRSSALLPGDCEYNAMPNDLVNKKQNYVIVPHHCARMSKSKIKAAGIDCKAILSYGFHNIHNHPDNQHMKELFDNGFEIIPTANYA